MAKLKSSFSILRQTVDIFKPQYGQIFYPFIVILFINLLILEILYFSTRYPLVGFFGPIISRIWGEEYLHYPVNFLLLPKILYHFQIVNYLFISSVLICSIIPMVSAINSDQRVNFNNALRQCNKKYVYIVLFSLLPLMLFQAFDYGYSLLIHRALKIHSTTGIFFWIKKTVLFGAPYAQFLYGIFATVIFIYMPVSILLDKKKFITAFMQNFKILFGSFRMTLMIVLVPTLMYLPLLLLRDNSRYLIETTFPEIQLIILALSIIVTTAINLFIMASATTFYLYKKEHS